MKLSPLRKFSSKPVLLTKVSGLRESKMGRENKSGLMEANMLGSGKITRLMDMEPYTILMEIFMRANGQMIRPMGRAPIPILMVLSTLESGKTISNMGMEFKSG